MERFDRCFYTLFRRSCQLAALLLLALSFPLRLAAQGQDLTVVVLVNSTNTQAYNTNPASPGTYQMGPERYFVHMQVPYRLIDVSTTSAQDLSAVQLIIAGHSRLALSAAWQNAIANAVFAGTGFVNLDSDPGIGQQTHIQQIFGATGSTIGADQTSIVIPAAVQVGGATPHYIAALQRHFTGDTAPDLTYSYHGNGSVYIPSDATILTGAQGTVVAKLGTDPLILATSYGKGRAVDFTTTDYLHADRFGFVMGVDDLFWRSLVWSARKPFVLRGYPRFAAVQLDDNEVGLMSRIPDLWNTALTGNTASDGTGGPWNPQVNLQLGSLSDPAGERAQLISAIQANHVRASPHGLNYGSGGDLYWNLTVPNTDAQWQTSVAAAMQWRIGQGGSDTFPPFSRSMVGHFWDISNNAGYEMYNSLGLRYVTSPQTAGVYYFTSPKTPAMRIPLGPFRIYEQPPLYSGDLEETFPFFYADDINIGSVAGKPTQQFYAFASQVGQSAGRFSRPDAVFPSSQTGYTPAQSLNQWEYYMWRFWSGMAPVQIYTHDGNNLEYTTPADRQAFITQLSQWFGTNHGQHVFMDDMGDYLRARNHSLLASASLNSTALTLNFTGAATDADGNLIDTKTYVFYGDDEGTLLDVPGFTNGATYSFPNALPASMQISPLSLSFATSPGNSPAPQNLTVNNVGAGTFNWTVTSNAPWLSAAAAAGSSGTPASIQVNSASLAAGNYSGSLVFSASGALNSPQTVPVSLVVSAAALVPSPAALTFSGTVGGPAPSPASVAINNPSGTSLAWTASSDSPWLRVATGTAGTPGTAIVSVNPAGLSLGVYSGNITLTPPAGTANPVTVPVSFQLSGVIANPSTANLNAWTVSPLGNAAAWSSSGTSILYSGSTESQLYTGSATWTDYDLDVNLTLSSLNDYPGGIRARVNPATGAGYALWMYPGERSLSLFRVVNWNISNGYTLLATASGIPFTTAPHTLRLSAHGNQLSAAYDGVIVLSVLDSTYTSGVIALDPSSLPVAYNNVVVSSATSPPTTLSASPANLSFTANAGSASGSPQTVTLSSSPGSVSWSATSSVPWLSLATTQGASTPATITVNASAASLSAGTYSGTVNLTPSAGSSVQLPVTFTVNAVSPVLQVSPASATLQAYVGQTPPPFSFSVANGAGTPFTWTASSNQSWLTLAPTSGSGASTFTATASIQALLPGTYNATVTVASPSLVNSPVAIPITLTVSNATLSDNFTHNASGWVISPSGLATNFSVANQTYSYKGGGNTQSCSGSPTYADFEFDFGLRLSPMVNYPGGVRGRVNPSTGAGYGLWFYPADGIVKLLNISAWSANSSTAIAQAPIKLDTLQHAYRLVFSGSTITAYQDGITLLTASDPTYKTGYVCFDPSSVPVAYTQAIVISSASGATLTTAPTALTFSATAASNPPSQTLSVGASTPVTYGIVSSAPWLTATLSTATAPATITVSVNSSALANGSYSGSLTLYSPGSTNAPLVIPVTFSVSSSSLAVNPKRFDLFAPVGTSPPPVTLAVQNTGTGTFSWTASSDSNWLVPSPSAAAQPGTLTLTSSTASLPTGATLANVTVASSASGSATVPVTVHLGTQVFVDNFASGSAQWTPSPLGRAANWSVLNNAFRYNGGGHTQQYAGSANWTNYTVSTNVTLSNLSDYPGGLRGRVNVTTGAAYVAWLYPAERLIKLYRTTAWNIDSSGLTLLGQSPAITMNTSPHFLRLAFSGSQITVYYDNQAVITASDSVLPSGAIALDVSSQPVSFGSVTVLQ